MLAWFGDAAISAFAEACRAVERARAAGVSVGCNVFLTTASLPQLDELATALPPLGVHAMSIETASFLPTPSPGATGGSVPPFQTCRRPPLGFSLSLGNSIP